MLTLRQGDRGDSVRRLQELLVRARVATGVLRVDGIFGPDTLQAVAAIQRKLGIPSAGVVDPRTWDAISRFKSESETESRATPKPKYPKPWNWDSELPPSRLIQWHLAPNSFGFYEIGDGGESFEALYCGRAAGTTIHERLCKHYRNSHNANIRKHRDTLYFRYKVFTSPAVAKFVEALHITAMEYPWNDREEWKQHSILEV